MAGRVEVVSWPVRAKMSKRRDVAVVLAAVVLSAKRLGYTHLKPEQQKASVSFLMGNDSGGSSYRCHVTAVNCSIPSHHEILAIVPGLPPSERGRKEVWPAGSKSCSADIISLLSQHSVTK